MLYNPHVFRSFFFLLYPFRSRLAVSVRTQPAPAAPNKYSSCLDIQERLRSCFWYRCWYFIVSSVCEWIITFRAYLINKVA